MMLKPKGKLKHLLLSLYNEKSRHHMALLNSIRVSIRTKKALITIVVHYDVFNTTINTKNDAETIG